MESFSLGASRISRQKNQKSVHQETASLAAWGGGNTQDLRSVENKKKGGWLDQSLLISKRKSKTFSSLIQETSEHAKLFKGGIR